MGYTKKKQIKVAKYIKENKPKENSRLAHERNYFCQRQQNVFRIVTRTGKLKCLPQHTGLHMKSSLGKTSGETSLAALQWSGISLHTQRSFIKSENLSLLNSNKSSLNPCAKAPVVYKTSDFCAGVESDKLICSAAWSPFIQMHRINDFVSSGQTEFLTNEKLKPRETASNQLIEKKNENCLYQQSSKNSCIKYTNNKIAARALLQPIVRLERMDVKPTTKPNKACSGIKMCAVTKSAQNNEQIVDRKSTIRNNIKDQTLRSNSQSHFQLVQDKIVTRRRRGRLQLKKQSIEEIQEISARLMKDSCKGNIQNQTSNNVNNLFPKPLKRETVDLFPSRGFYSDSVRTLPKPIRVKREISIERIQPIVRIQRLKCMHQKNEGKEIRVKQEHITKNLQPIVKLQRLNLTKERVIPSRKSFSDTSKLKSKTKKPHRVQLETNVPKKQPIVKLKRFKILQEENKKKFIRKSVSIASKNMQPKVKLKRLKLTLENSGNQSSADKLKPNVISNIVPFLRLKRLQLKYFLQLTSGRFLLTDTCLRKKKKNALKFKPIQVKLEEFEKFDYLVNSQQSNNCNIIEIKQEIDSAEEQSTLMARPNQRLRNNCSAFSSNPNAKLNSLNKHDSALKEANFNNRNLISIKTEPVFDPEN